jgi:hypothetical protein
VALVEGAVLPLHDAGAFDDVVAPLARVLAAIGPRDAARPMKLVVLVELPYVGCGLGVSWWCRLVEIIICTIVLVLIAALCCLRVMQILVRSLQRR